MLEKTAAVKRDLEKVGEIPELMFRLLILLNFLIVLFVTLISAHALWGYVNEGTALDFLLSAGRIPPANWVLPVTGIMLFGCLVLLLTVECNNHPELVSKLTVEFAIAIGVSYVTGFGYTGMIVLLLADIMRYTIDWKKRALYILAVSIFYLFMNGNALRDWLGAIPLSVSWEYYRADHYVRFLSILSMLTLINMFVFIFYMVLMVLAQTSEKESILKL
ncbi:MAG: hypothetical protein J6E40_14035, partial [Lachnospiraceae bacterium]|nr:hypothetical protein [Lachnospiraceae bacterium]